MRKHFNITVEEEEREVMDISSENNISQEFQSFSFVENNKLPKFWFDLSLSEEQWKSISPISKIYKEKGTKGKTYKVLNVGWTDIISKACFLKNKLPCAHVFKYGKIFESPEAETYLKIYGLCKKCGAEFKAHCLYEPTPGTGIVLRVHTVDTSGISHKKKRAIKNKTRIAIGQELLNVKPRLTK